MRFFSFVFSLNFIFMLSAHASEQCGKIIKTDGLANSSGIITVTLDSGKKVNVQNGLTVSGPIVSAFAGNLTVCFDVDDNNQTVLISASK